MQTRLMKALKDSKRHIEYKFTFDSNLANFKTNDSTSQSGGEFKKNVVNTVTKNAEESDNIYYYGAGAVALSIIVLAVVLHNKCSAKKKMRVPDDFQQLV